MFSRLRVRRGSASSRSAQHDHARRRSYAAYNATDRWWVVTDHDRLQAATHDHARDWRDSKACGGRAGWHEQIFGNRTVGWTIARCHMAGNYQADTLLCRGSLVLRRGHHSLHICMRQHWPFRSTRLLLHRPHPIGHWLIFHRSGSSECETQHAFTRSEDHP